MNPWGLFIGLVFIAIGLGIAFGVDVWHYIFPLILIFIGLSIIFGHTTGQSRHAHSWGNAGTPQNPMITHEDTLDYSFTFSGGDIQVVTDNFQGGKVSTVFGGANIDLRNAILAKNGMATIDVSSIFGGVKIFAPKTWLVQGSLSGAFGGFSNKTVPPEKPQGTLHLKGSAVFGGVEVVN